MNRVSARRCVVALVLELQALSATAANLVVNPDFDTDISGWTLAGSGGTISFNAANGYPAPGSLDASAPAASTSALATQCIVISAPLNVDFIVDVHEVAVAGGEFTVDAIAYTNADCTGTNLGHLLQGSVTFPAPGWFEPAVVNTPLPAGTQSVLILIGAGTGSGAGSFSHYYFDHVRFGETGSVPVTLQAFDVI